jgi:hypothetical protein
VGKSRTVTKGKNRPVANVSPPGLKHNYSADPCFFIFDVRIEKEMNVIAYHAKLKMMFSLLPGLSSPKRKAKPPGKGIIPFQ